MLPTKPTAEENDAPGGLFEEIKSIVFWENAGFKTDWDCYPFEYKKLFAMWRDAEGKVRDARKERLQQTIEAVLRIR